MSQNSITISYDPSAELIEINGTTYAKQKPIAPEPKKRLSREDIPHLEEIMNKFKEQFCKSTTYEKIRDRSVAELFLCIECLKLGGECFGKLDGQQSWYSPIFNSYSKEWVVNEFLNPIFYGGFWFSNLRSGEQFLAIPGVIDALNTHGMVG